MANSITGSGTITTSGYFTIGSTTDVTGPIYGAATVTPTITNFGTVKLSAIAVAAIDLEGGGTITNAGSLYAGTFGNGVQISATSASVGALVTNDSGHIIAGKSGIFFNSDAAGTVVNAGTIAGLLGSAIFSYTTATITNSGTLDEVNPGGANTAFGGAIDIAGAAFIGNSGLIVSQNVENFNGALGVETGSGTVINAGTIQGAGFNGTTYSIDFTAASGGDLLMLDAGQKLGGIALAHGSLNTVGLAAGAAIGSLANPGNYIDFQTLAVERGADWNIGAAGATANLTSFSTILDSGTLNLAGSISTTSAVTLASNGTGGVGTLNIAAGSNLIDATGQYGVTSVYAANTDPIVSNQGSIIADSTSNNGTDIGIFLRGGTVASFAFGAAVVNGSSTNSTALIDGFRYGVDFEAGSLTPSGSTGAYISLVNFGTIENTASATQGFNAAVVAGFRTAGTIVNASSGLIIGNTGFGVYEKSDGGKNDLITNAGTIDSQAGFASAKIFQNNAGTGTILNTGFLQHGADLNEVVGGTIINAGTIGTLGGTGSLAKAAVIDTNQGVLLLDPGQSLSGGIATFGAGSTLDLAGTAGQIGTLVNPGSYFGFTTVTIGSGTDWSIGAGSISGVTAISNFGTLNLASPLGGASINMEGSLGGTSVVDFTGGTAEPIYDYGANDSIIISTLSSVAGGGYFDSYNTATGVLTVTETNAAGAIIGTSNVTVAAAAGTTLGTNSFAAFSDGSGTTIELGSDVTTTLSNVIFNSQGSVTGGETISGVLHSVYNSAGTLIGETGTLTLLETLSNGSITTETFVINPTLATSSSNDYGEGIANSSGGIFQVLLESVSSTGTGPLFTDLHLDWNSPTTQNLFLGDDGQNYSALTGPTVTTQQLQSVGAQTTSGSIVIDHGQTVPISNLSSVDSTPAVFGTNNSSISLNTFDINATVTGTNSPYTGAISGFGVNDDILLSPLVLPSVAAGSEISLAYAGSLLSVTEVNSAGATIGATTLDVGTGYAAGSFVALLGADGVNIETAQSVDEKPLTFNATGTASFEDPTKYSGGLAPGGSIVAGETVSIASGTASIASTAQVNNTGTILVTGSSSGLLDSSALTGTGTVVISGGGTLTLANTTGATTDTISLGTATSGSPNVLNLDGAGTASFAGIITGEGANDQIDLGGSFLPTPGSATDIGLSFNTATGVLTIADTVGSTIHTDTLTFSGAVPANFAATIGANGIVITDIPCFASGTRILTGLGPRKVENLAVGDKVLSARDGEDRKIIWVGQRTIDLSRHANPDKVMPVVIKAGACGDGVPERDLRVSPDHALFIDGHLIEAKTLVNGATIIRDRAAKFVTYHHIELERHDVVLAEGLPAETYLESGNRQNFETDAGSVALHPDFAAASRHAACAALALDGDIVRRAKQRLMDRALSLGFTRTDDIDLVVRTGGEVIEPHKDLTGHELMFVLPANARTVTLLSATGVPAETSADPSDRRILGAAITGLALITGGRRITIDLNDAFAGFHDAEPGQRWTNGNATIELPSYAGRAVLEVSLAGQAMRWQAPKPARQFINA